MRLEETGGDLTEMPGDDAGALIHELKVHQAELEIQNEELRRAQLELAESRDQYMDLYEMAPSGYVTLDERRVIREANLTFCKFAGLERRKVIGRRFAEFVLEDRRDECFRHLRGIIKSRSEQSFETALKPSDDPVIWVQIKCMPNSPDSRWPEGCRGIITDITQRRNMEGALRENEARLQMALDVGGMGTWEYDLKGDRSSWDRRLYKLLGYDGSEKLEPETFFEHIHEEDRPRVTTNLERSLMSGSRFSDEFRVVRKDGQVRWFVSDGYIERNEKGEPVRLVGINYDSTERKRLEQDLQNMVDERTVQLMKSQRRYQELVENTGDIVYSMDANGTILFMGPGVKDYGFDPGDMLGKNCLDFVVGEDRERVAEDMRRTFSAGKEFPTIFRLKHPGEEDVWLEETGRVRRNSRGEVTGLIGALRDVTRRVQQEELIVRQRDDLRTLALQIVNAQEEERQKIAEGLHDEVGQLLAACRLKLSEMETCNKVEEACELGRRAEECLEKASDEIRSLTFELGSKTLFQSGLANALEELCRYMQHMFGVKCELESKEDLSAPETLRPSLYQCARELLLNVVKHAGTDKVKVEIGYSAKDNGERILRIRVKDDGKGFDTSALNRPLSFNGGFGLYHVRERMRSIGGDLKIKSVPGDGTEAALEVGVGA